MQETSRRPLGGERRRGSADPVFRRDRHVSSDDLSLQSDLERPAVHPTSATPGAFTVFAEDQTLSMFRPSSPLSPLVLAGAILLTAGNVAGARETFTTATVEVDGTRIHYRIAGEGPPLLLLHGYTLTGAWLEPLAGHFTDRYTTIVPDLPGHGRSSAGPDPYRFDEVARLVLALMDHLAVERFHAIGNSGGGIVLTHMAARHPERIEAMALLASPHVPSPEVLAGYPEFAEHPAAVREHWLKVHPRGRSQIDRLISSFRNLAPLHEAMAVRAERLEEIPTRTLIVVGDRDPLVPLAEATEMYEALPEAALWVIPMQGHAAFWPDWGGSPEASSILPDVIRRFFAFGADEGFAGSAERPAAPGPDP